MDCDFYCIGDWVTMTSAGMSLAACFLVFWTSFVVEGFYMRIRNVFIALQQIAHALIAAALLLGFLNDRGRTFPNGSDFYIYRVAGVLMQTGLSSSIFWFLFMSFYYFLRYYLKFYYIARYFMIILVFSLVIPLAGFIFHEYRKASEENFEYFEEFLWTNYKLAFLAFSIVAGFTLVFQVATFSILSAHYRKKFSSTFKKRVIFFDFAIFFPVFGSFGCAVLMDLINSESLILKKVVGLFLALLGVLRFLLSECIANITMHIRKSKAKEHDLEKSLLK